MSSPLQSHGFTLKPTAAELPPVVTRGTAWRQRAKHATKLEKASRRLMGVALLAISSQLVGCIGYARNAIPADRLPPELRICEKGCRVPINFALLGQEQPREYVLQAGDVIGVYIRGVLPPDVEETPIVTNGAMLQRIYYPPKGNVETPAVGAPLEISENGELLIPLVGTVKIDGLTVEQARLKVAEELVKKDVVKKDREFVYLKLVRPRVKRIVVIREDSPVTSPALTNQAQYILAKRGTGEVIDLPAYEDDVLHALAATGGLPGTDAMNEVWVLRKQSINEQLFAQFETQSGTLDTSFISDDPNIASTATRLRLWTRPGECTPFNSQDILLEEGDVVYLRPRQQDVFYTGGLLPGGTVPLPRDYDIDILEAISMAQGSVGGPTASHGGSFRPISGNRAVVPPSRALIVRKLENGDQVTIRVDLGLAMRDANHRIKIMPGDFVSVHFRPSELASNVALGLVNFNYVIPNN